MELKEFLHTAFYACVIGFFLGLILRCVEEKGNAKFLPVFFLSAYLIFHSALFFSSLVLAPISKSTRTKLFELTINYLERADGLQILPSDKTYLIESLVETSPKFDVLKLAFNLFVSYWIYWDLFLASLIKLAARECAENDRSLSYVDVFDFNVGGLSKEFNDRIPRQSFCL